MNTMNTTESIGKCSVWIYGSVAGPAGWIEGKILELGEGFKNQSEAKRWAREAMKRLNTERTCPSHYKIGPAY